MQPINDKDNNRNSNAIPRLLLTSRIQWKRKNDDYMWNIKGSEKSWS